MPKDSPLTSINKLYRADETNVLQALLVQVDFPDSFWLRVSESARSLVEKVREKASKASTVDAFMQRYALSSEEGILLMCLAEALLRIPDRATAEALLRDKLTQADFGKHLHLSPSMLVNTSTWALMLTSKLLDEDEEQNEGWGKAFKKLLARSTEPIIRKSSFQAMRILANKFVIGRSIEQSLKQARKDVAKGYSHSFDMLGEAALTQEDAERYFDAYRQAILSIAKANQGDSNIGDASISIKLSALHPRYSYSQKERAIPELTTSLKALALEAKQAGIGLTVDAEESERLEISLRIFENVANDPALRGWNGLGLAVQAYQKRATAVIDYLAELALKTNRRFPVRLVKGAYWDSEIKKSQELGLEGYPVFTRKASTDVSYIACARKLLDKPEQFYAQFATHNAHTLATILELAGSFRDFEFQKLHGMGDALYDLVVGEDKLNIPCRIYAPVGDYQDLLPYLVRRLLENGANSSFVNNIYDASVPIEDLIESPISKVRSYASIEHPKIPLPVNLYEGRMNSSGIDLSNSERLAPIFKALETPPSWKGAPIVGGEEKSGTPLLLFNPADQRQKIGEALEASEEHVVEALDKAAAAYDAWERTPADARANCLERMAELLERDRNEFIALCVYEGGKSIADGISEVREATDFCRYYAARGRADFGGPIMLPGPTGERNQLSLRGRGIFICISPWNFPLAIFLGQVSAALMAGNSVIAKPARQTPLIAHKAIKLLHEAGVPGDVLHFLPGQGSKIAVALIKDPRVAGVCFTGSTETAWSINQALAQKEEPIASFIAETGGQNVMIVDSSALPEQVVSDVLASSFQSAGQRCSALRILMLQEEIAPKVIEMLKGAMAELNISNPSQLSTDVGPVISKEAKAELEEHCARMKEEATLLYQCAFGDETENGSFMAPTAFEIPSLSLLKKEVFGPILHVLRFRASELDQMIEQINDLKYGLTFGLHTRIDHRIDHVAQRIKAGNMYVNRNMIGAVVGVQPFGGSRLSGTGPKAGGPFYLHRFATEQTLSVNTTAQGGNTSLMTLGE